MNCANCNGVIPMVGWNDKEFFENCPWCGVALDIEDETADAGESESVEETRDS
jgi:hypothetical protein